MENSFIDECNDWLGPLGYSLHNINKERTVLTFSNMKDHNNPMIRCVKNGNHKSCSLISNHSFRMGVEMSAQNLQFEHPDIRKYISVIKYYSILAENNPPNLKEM